MNGGIFITQLKSTVLREVGALARSIQSISDIKYREYNLQRGQFIFLTRICEYPGINLVDLSNILKVDKATTTKAVQKLMTEGYIERERSAEDKREWHLYPSLKAQEIYQFIIQEENRYIEICFTGFNQTERATVRQLLQQMSKNLEHDWQQLKKYKEE